MDLIYTEFLVILSEFNIIFFEKKLLFMKPNKKNNFKNKFGIGMHFFLKLQTAKLL